MPGPGTGWKPDATHWQDASVTSNSRRAPSLLSLAEWLRNTKTRLLAVAISLAAFTPVFCQTPPGITTHPADQVVDAGSTATFRVTATGTAPLTYQWRFHDANLAGRTSTSLVLSNVQSANLGNYTVVVTNASGPSVTSRTALLSLPTVHRLDGITANPDHTISLSLTGVVPSVFAPYYEIYPLDASTDMTNWSPLAKPLKIAAGRKKFLDWIGVVRLTIVWCCRWSVPLFDAQLRHHSLPCPSPQDMSIRHSPADPALILSHVVHAPPNVPRLDLPHDSLAPPGASSGLSPDVRHFS